MDQFLLQAIVDEAAPAVEGRPLDEVVQVETHRFVLRFGEPPFPRLHVAIHPRFTTFHLARRIKAPAAPTELAATMTRALGGARVTRLARPDAERIVRIEFDSGRTLVVELLGKASNLLLLDEEGRIVRFARAHHGAFRRPAEGDPYQPPPPSSRWVAPSPREVDRDAFHRAMEAPAGETDVEGALARRLLDRLPGFSTHLAREVEWRAARGEDPWEVFLDLGRTAAGGGRSPVMYSPEPPGQLQASLSVTSRNLFAFPFPLRCAAGLAATPAATVNEAEEMAAACLMRHLVWHALHQSLSGVLGEERRRLADLAAVLRAELSEAVATAATGRRRGELILAGMHAARREGGVVSVVDHYDAEGRTIAIPIDPRLDLNDNAQRYFKSARRAERARGMIPARLAAIDARAAQVEAALGRVGRSPTAEGLEALERDLQEAGLVRAFRKADRAEVGRRPEYVKVREFHTREGFTVLVGRTGAENDHLTFKVASPHDLWLHAAGWPGAHVVVRNPRRLGALPDATVREAAAIAAWFSKGRGEKDLDVHVAWRRHVRKVRGMSPGMVMLKRHRTVRVSPALPGPAAGPPGPRGARRDD